MKKESKQNVSKKLKVANLSSGQTNGLNSSLVFTPIQVTHTHTHTSRDRFEAPVSKGPDT